MKWIRHETKTEGAKAVATGAVAGLIGSWAMNRFQAAISHFQDGAPNQQHNEEPATAKTADRVWRTLSGQALDAKTRKQAEPWVHYGFGGLTGALYGALASSYPETEKGAGTFYGSVVWLLADEIGVPAAGLSKPPEEVPVSVHLMALASHLVYGIVLYGSSRVIRKLV